MTLLSKRQPEAEFSAPSQVPNPVSLFEEPQPTSRRSSRRPIGRWFAPVLLIASVAWLFQACTAGETSVESYVGITVPDESITEYVEQRRQELEIAGLTLAIVNDGEVAYAKTFGHADVEADQPVTDETIFEAASLSKSIFAHFVMTFVEDGDLDLDRPLHQYLPHPDVGGDRRAERITARMVLSHQGGFPNWRADQPDGLLPINFEPGTAYEYSGEGYQYLAMVLKDIAGTDWAGLEALFQQRIAEPLGLERTVFIPTPSTRQNKAQPYDHNGQPVDWRNDPGTASDDPFIAGASVHSDAADFSRWMIAVMNRELLTAASYDELFAPHSAPPAEDFDLTYTLGFFKPEIPFTDLYGHTGNNDGFTSMFMLDADKDWGFVLFSNSEYGGELGENLFEYLLVGPSIPKLAVTVLAAGILVVAPLVMIVRAIRRRRRMAA